MKIEKVVLVGLLRKNRFRDYIPNYNFAKKSLRQLNQSIKQYAALQHDCRIIEVLWTSIKIILIIRPKELWTIEHARTWAIKNKAKWNLPWDHEILYYPQIIWLHDLAVHVKHIAYIFKECIYREILLKFTFKIMY